MASSERRIDAATRWVERQLRALGLEIREARLAAGLSQVFIARLAGTSSSQLSRIEHGQLLRVPLLMVARVMAVVGLDLSVRGYPGAQPVRDRGQLALLGRLRARVRAGFRWRSEVPMPIAGDRRAWDADIRGHGVTIGVEAEARLRDVQAVERRIALKQRDSRVDHVILLLADTQANRLAVRAHADALRTSFPISARSMLAALAEGRDPGGSAVVVL